MTESIPDVFKFSILMNKVIGYVLYTEMDKKSRKYVIHLQNGDQMEKHVTLKLRKLMIK